LDKTIMGKASRTKADASRREKIAAQRAAERRAEQRRRILIASGSILAVLAIVVAFVVVKANSKPSAPTASSSASNGPTGAALASVINDVTSVPASTLDTVGDGSGAFTNKIQTIKPAGTPLTANGKPEMLYMGAEYCPYCAAARWAMIVALSRFGTFSGLQTIHSAAKDGAGHAEPDPNTPTWTFAHATYTSKYLTFTPVELQTNIPDTSTGTYTNLQTPTKAQEALLTKYDAPPYITSSEAGAIPFVDFGNKYLMIATPYDPGVLSGLSWNTIAADLHNPNSAVAKAVDGTANYFTAAICKMTGNQPASACTATVQSLEKGI
jgi:thiol-disulfide isomerase/thioredoxin